MYSDDDGHIKDTNESGVRNTGKYCIVILGNCDGIYDVSCNNGKDGGGSFTYI